MNPHIIKQRKAQRDLVEVGNYYPGTEDAH
jgi:hypothetical protein